MAGKMKCPVCEAVLQESRELDLNLGQIETSGGIEQWQCPTFNCRTRVMRPLTGASRTAGAAGSVQRDQECS